MGGELGPSYRGALAQAGDGGVAGRMNGMRTQQYPGADRSDSVVGQGLWEIGCARSAEASALAMQQAPKRLVGMERDLQQMQLKFNLTQSAAARKMEAEKVAAAVKADAGTGGIESGEAGEGIVAQEREAAILERMRFWPRRVAAQKAALRR